MDRKKIPGGVVPAFLLIVFIYMSLSGFGPTISIMSNGDTTSMSVLPSQWDSPQRIESVSPDWGLCASCNWAVFISGEGFEGESTAELVTGDDIIEARKATLCNDSTILAVFDLRGAEPSVYDVHINSNRGEAVLEDCFRIDRGLGSESSVLFEDPTDGSSEPPELHVEAHSPDALHIGVKGASPGTIDKAYLVAQGQLIEGAALAKEPEDSQFDFDMSGTPPVEYDLVLTTEEGFNIYFENAVGLQDRYNKASINVIDPSYASAEGVVEIRVYGENLHDGAAWFLATEGIEIGAVQTIWVDTGQVICIFNLDGAQPGTYGIKAREDNGTEVSLDSCLTINENGAEEEARFTPAPSRTPAISPGEPASGETGAQPQEPAQQAPTVAPERVYENATIQPTSGPSGGMVEIVISGGQLSGSLQARLSGSSATAWSVQCSRLGGARLSCSFNLYGLPAGSYRVQVLDYSGNLVCEAGYFEVY